MNTCGYDHNLTLQFCDLDEINDIEAEYRFTEWFQNIVPEIGCKFNKSFVVPFNDLIPKRPIATPGVCGLMLIDKLISELGGQCFARLDVLSTKPLLPYTSAEQIITDFQTNSRTMPFIKSNMPVIIREWNPLIKDAVEFRCFVHDRVLRGISIENGCISPNELNSLKKTVKLLTIATDYDDYTADFCIINGELWLIEINTPVWLFACSGLFNLEDPMDREILMGQYLPDLFEYPVIKNN